MKHPLASAHRHGNAAVRPEDEAPLVPRKLLWRHDGLPFSSALALVRLLDGLDVRNCSHCEDMRYDLIRFIKGLSPLARVPDVITAIPAGAYASKTKRVLSPGMVAV